MRMRLLGMLFLFVLTGFGSAFAAPAGSLTDLEKNGQAAVVATSAERSFSVVAEQSGDGPRLLLTDKGAGDGSRIAFTDAEATGRYALALNLPSSTKRVVASVRVSGAGLGGATLMACTRAMGVTIGSSVKTAAKTADGMTKKSVFA